MLLIFAGCSLFEPTTSKVNYGEDLSAHRPQISPDTTAEVVTTKREVPDVTPSNHQNQELNSKLNAIAAFNKSEGTLNGFTIQVYSGTSRDDASKAKAKVYTILPDSRPVTNYEQPIYKVRVGAFGDRLEAQGVYGQLVAEFPTAIVIPSKIKIN